MLWISVLFNYTVLGNKNINNLVNKQRYCNHSLVDFGRIFRTPPSTTRHTQRRMEVNRLQTNQCTPSWDPVFPNTKFDTNRRGKNICVLTGVMSIGTIQESASQDWLRLRVVFHFHPIKSKVLNYLLIILKTLRCLVETPYVSFPTVSLYFLRSKKDSLKLPLPVHDIDLTRSTISKYKGYEVPCRAE